jgi:hypothetical protein
MTPQASVFSARSEPVGFHIFTPVTSQKPPNNNVSGKVSSRIVVNMQNGGLGYSPRPAQATIKVLGRFHQSGLPLDLEPGDASIFQEDAKHPPFHIHLDSHDPFPPSDNLINFFSSFQFCSNSFSIERIPFHFKSFHPNLTSK